MFTDYVIFAGVRCESPTLSLSQFEALKKSLRGESDDSEYEENIDFSLDFEKVIV